MKLVANEMLACKQNQNNLLSVQYEMGITMGQVITGGRSLDEEGRGMHSFFSGQ